MKIIVIAGTADAKEIIGNLYRRGADVTATVTTNFGARLLGIFPGVDVRTGRLTGEEMAAMLKEIKPAFLLDASHPYAGEASMNAITACRNTGVSYLRFERKPLQTDREDIIRVRSFEEAAVLANEADGNIFLTTGSNTLEIFTKHVTNFRERLFARVLPDSRILEKCEKAGLTAENIIAVKGPFSEELNLALFRKYKASVLVTKESGETGGTGEKLKAAEKLGIRVILVDRPQLDYGTVASSTDEVLEFMDRLKRG